MVIRIFIFVLLSIASIIYFIPVANKAHKDEQKDIALFTFHNSTMYTLNDVTTTRIVHAKQVTRYQYRDVMYNGEIVLKAKDNKVKNAMDIISADVIIKKGEDYTFLHNVKYRRNDFISLNTEELFYNAQTQIAKNRVPFDGTYYNHYMKGRNLFVDSLKNEMSSTTSHFEIETNN